MAKKTIVIGICMLSVSVHCHGMLLSLMQMKPQMPISSAQPPNIRNLCSSPAQKVLPQEQYSKNATRVRKWIETTNNKNNPSSKPIEFCQEKIAYAQKCRSQKITAKDLRKIFQPFWLQYAHQTKSSHNVNLFVVEFSRSAGILIEQRLRRELNCYSNDHAEDLQEYEKHSGIKQVTQQEYYKKYCELSRTKIVCLIAEESAYLAETILELQIKSGRNGV